MPPRAPRLPGATTPTPGVALATGLAQALPACLEILADGHRTRANIRTSVEAITASHRLRGKSFDELAGVLDRWGHEMSQDVRDAYFLQMRALYDAGHYHLPWDRLLPSM